MIGVVEWWRLLAYKEYSYRLVREFFDSLAGPTAAGEGRDPRVDPRVGDIVLPWQKTPHVVERVWPAGSHRADEPVVEYRPGGLTRTREFSLRRWREWFDDAAVLFIALDRPGGKPPTRRR